MHISKFRVLKYTALFIMHCALCIGLFSCAIQVAPSGGEKDITPPKVEKYIPENYSTNFKTNEIVINFDEYVQLKELTSQLVVSPPLKYPVKTKIKKKSLLIHIEDTLHQDATYTMNFGNAIVDLHEGNVLENFQYVFSTGDIIDSLMVGGKIENALNEKTEKGIYAMLYRDTDASTSALRDSLPLKTIPDYFAKTDESGMFQIRNVSPGNYKIVALKDDNSNYIFDSNDELIAFRDSAVAAGSSGLSLRLFKEPSRQQLLRTYSDEPGKAMVIYNRPLASQEITFLSDTSLLHIYSALFSPGKDTLTIWYRNQLSDSLSLVLKPNAVNDSIIIRLRRSDTKGRFKYVPALTTQFENKTETMLELGRQVELIFNHPVEKHDLKNILVTEDSLPLKNIKIAFTDSLKRILHVDYPWKDKSSYIISIPKETMTDIFGIKNDSLEFTFRTKSMADYGTVALKLQLPKNKKQFLVQLIPTESGDKESVARQHVINADTTLHYEFLNPGIYRIKLIEDSNANGQWDTGNYLQHLQPEPVFYYKDNITVRANWDVDVKWKVE